MPSPQSGNQGARTREGQACPRHHDRRASKKKVLIAKLPDPTERADAKLRLNGEPGPVTPSGPPEGRRGAGKGGAVSRERGVQSSQCTSRIPIGSRRPQAAPAPGNATTRRGRRSPHRRNVAAPAPRALVRPLKARSRRPRTRQPTQPAPKHAKNIGGWPKGATMPKKAPLRPLRRPPSASTTDAGEMLKGTLLQKYMPRQEIKPARGSDRPAHQRHRGLKGRTRLPHAHAALA